MAGFKAQSTGVKAALLAGGVAVAALAGYGGWVLRKAPPMEAIATPPAAASDPTPTETAVPNAAVAPDPVAAAVPTEPAVPADPTSAIAPSFDLVRVEPDGSTVVAGQAEPGSKIILRVDGVEISATTADANGNFVGLFVLESSATPRLLTMSSILPGQTEVAAAAQVALAPIEAPVVVAAADPAPADAPVPPESAEVETAAPPLNSAEPAAPTAPAALLVTKDGVKVLQSGDQTVASDGAADLSIDTISYTPNGDVQLSGRAASGAALRIYLDNAPLIDVTADETGLWASTMPPITPGIYTLRVDQLAADGSVSARVETPFKRETEDALAAATQAPDAAAVVAVAEPAINPTPAADPVATTTTAKPAVDSVATETAEPAAPAATENTASPVAVASTAAKPAPPVSITVQPGFTLWGIASQQFGDGVMYVQVFEANKDKIRDPNLIYPGQVFVIPTASE